MATVSEHKPQVPIIAPPRLPYHPAIEERFGIDKSQWKALVEAVFPLATTTDSVILALSYCRARKLDPFKRVVHIVPIWNKQIGRMVDTVWPGIGELRTTAFRTGQYAGKCETVFGPDVHEELGGVAMTFPEWAQVTVKRIVCGHVVDFCGPRVYWKETYATAKRDTDAPNEMWRDRPRGQIDKCAEAAALRTAFPEEIGGDLIDDEVAAYSRSRVVEQAAPSSVAELTNKLTASPAAPAPAVEYHDPEVPVEQYEAQDPPAEETVPNRKRRKTLTEEEQFELSQGDAKED